MTRTAGDWPARLAHLSVRYRILIVIVAFVITAAALPTALNLVRLHVRTNFFALLPADQPSVQTLNRVVDKLGGWGDLVAVIESSDAAGNLRFAKTLRAALSEADWLNHSEFGIDDGFLARHALLFLSPADLEEIAGRIQARRDYEVSKRDPMFVDLLDAGPPSVDMSDIERKYRAARSLAGLHASADGHTLIVTIYPKGVSGNIRDTRRIVRDLDARIATIDRRAYPSDLAVRLGGTFHDRLEEYDAIQRDLAIGAAVMVALFIALLLWQFRQLVALPLVLLPCLLPMIWTFALARVVVSELNLITVFLVNVLLGLGIDFSIHGFSRFLEERSAGADTRSALAAVNSHTVRASWSAALTTIVAFAVLVPMRFLGFQQFGIIAALGLTLAFASACIVLPSLVAIADSRGWIAIRPFAVHEVRHRRTLPSNLVLTVSVCLAAVGLVAVWKVPFEFDFSRLRTRLSEPARELRDTVRQIQAGARDPIVILAADLDETRTLQAALRERRREHPDDTPYRSVVSVLDVVPDDQPARLAVIARLHTLVNDVMPFASDADRAALERLAPLLDERGIQLSDLPEGVRRRFFGLPGTPGNLVYVLHDVPLADTRRAAELVSSVRTIEVDGHTWHGASDAIVVDDLLRVMREDSRIAIPLAALAVFLVLLLDFRSPRRAMIAALPLVIGVLWLMAILWLSGMRLNFYNMVVFPTLLGLGVDAGIHYYRRFLEAPDDWGPENAGSTRLAVTTSALTSIISFGSLAASVHQGLASLGMVAVLGVGSTLIATVVLMPVILTRYRRYCR